jgi:hypothetical protein
MNSVEAATFLNSDHTRATELSDELAGAAKFDVAVAYPKQSGARILAAGLPPRSRFVVGTGSP